MRYILILLLAVGLMGSCKSASERVIGNPTPEELASGIQLLDKNTFEDAISRRRIQLVDVRTPEEYEAGHIEKATNIDFLADNFEQNIQEINKDRPVFIYCRSGGRSGQA
ncbi:MAG: rhodanese-like domain-containing protein, partial [Bacteroidia bacterium]|nr:rhodanese-like domain-containing protein [Bacteroidia bacterium]